MPVLGRKSKERLLTVHPKLRQVIELAIVDAPIDFTILWGHRGEAEQNLAYQSGASEKQWPDSKHNSFPSIAIDFAPWYAEKPNIRWEEVDEFGFVAGWIFAHANALNVKLRWGGLWSFNDVGHIELILD